MKKSLFAALAMTTVALFASAPTASAHPYPPSHIYISGYQSCGTPIYQERYFVRYSKRGTIVWAYRSVPAHRYYQHIRRPMPPRHGYHHHHYHRRPQQHHHHYRGNIHGAPVHYHGPSRSGRY